MSTIMAAHQQWASRRPDERFESLPALHDKMMDIYLHSRAAIVSSRKIEAAPGPDPMRDLLISGPNGHAYAPTHWAFGQLAQLAGAPPGYLRQLPPPLVADNLNYGLKFKRDIEDVGVLLYRDESQCELSAATGPRYGRIWNHLITGALIERFGDGVTGAWKVPGEFGQDVVVTKANTTIFGGDRDMFVFLADERNRIEIGDRRNGQPGSFARGFFVWNSPVGAATLGAAFFLFDYVCCNRIVWGARDYQEIRIRHTSGAPDRWLEEVSPVLLEYSEASAKPVLETIEAARAKKIDRVEEWLTGRYGKSMAADLVTVHQSEEHRPIETLWDATTAITALARSKANQDERVKLERMGGAILDLAA